MKKIGLDQKQGGGIITSGIIFVTGLSVFYYSISLLPIVNALPEQIETVFDLIIPWFQMLAVIVPVISTAITIFTVILVYELAWAILQITGWLWNKVVK